jgi:methyl-accepting chemotaxis protein
MLARLRIGPKLLLAPGVVLLLLVLLSGGSYYAMVRQNDSLDSIVQRRAAHMRAATELSAAARSAHAQAYQVLTWISGSFPPFRVDPLALDLKGQQGAIDHGLAQLARQTAGSPDERRYVEQARAAWAQYVTAVRDVVEIARIDQSISANAMVKAERAFAIVAQRLADLARREQALSEQASADAAGDFRLIAILMPVVIALSIAASLAITMAVRRALLADIGAIGAAASGLASGDLTIRARATGGDEIAETARALDAGIRGLNGQLRGVLESARSIGAASREITLGRAGLPPRAHVRATLEYTTTSMRALVDALGDGASGVRAAGELAVRAGAVAEEGNGMVHRLVTTMEQVRRATVRLERIGAAIEGTLTPTAARARRGRWPGARITPHARHARSRARPWRPSTAAGWPPGRQARPWPAWRARWKTWPASSTASAARAARGRATWPAPPRRSCAWTSSRSGVRAWSKKRRWPRARCSSRRRASRARWPCSAWTKPCTAATAPMKRPRRGRRCCVPAGPGVPISGSPAAGENVVDYR